MRQILSIRFVAAVAAVVGLFFLLTTIFFTREVVEDVVADDGPDEVELHKIDLVEQVFSSRNARFRVVDGAAMADTELIIDGTRSVFVVAGTPGVDHCPEFGRIGACAVAADLIGEAVVWFALVPMGTGRIVEFPAIDTLDDGLATLVNGWQLPFAPILDRRCRAPGGGLEEFASYREFREIFGDDFISVYDIDERRLVAVECRERVPYAPDPVPTTAPGSSVAGASVPSGSAPPDTGPSATGPES
jgi:hypothetical protein